MAQDTLRAVRDTLSRVQERGIVRARFWHAHRFGPAMSNIPERAASADCTALSIPGPLAAAPPATRATRPTSIADRVARAFPPLACVRGFRYFARRRVELSNVSERALDAEVKGKRMQHVKLRVEDGRLAAACSCAAKVLGPATCRHVWATLLEIDRQGAFANLRGTQRVLALGALDGPRPKRKAPAPAPAPAAAATSAPSKTSRKPKTVRVKRTS